MYIEQPVEFKEDIYHIASWLLTVNGQLDGSVLCLLRQCVPSYVVMKPVKTEREESNVFLSSYKFNVFSQGFCWIVLTKITLNYS